MENIIIDREYNVNIRRFGTRGSAFTVRFRNLDNVRDVREYFIDSVDRLIDRALANNRDHDLVGVEIDHPLLDRPVLIRFKRRDQLDG